MAGGPIRFVAPRRPGVAEQSQGPNLATIRELRRALFEVADQDRPADLVGAIALASGDPDLGGRLFSLMDRLVSDSLLPREFAREASALCGALGIGRNPVEPGVYPPEGRVFVPAGKRGTVIATGEPSEEHESVSEPGRRDWITASGIVMEH